MLEHRKARTWTKPPWTRLLVVEVDEGVRQAILQVAAEWKAVALEAESAQSARTALDSRPDVLFVDIHLPDASGITVIEAALRSRPIPAIIAISGEVCPKEAFQLARLGVRGYLGKPVSLDEIRVTREAIVGRPGALDVLAASRVGRESLSDVQADIRRAMVEQALAMTDGNRTEAARLLGVTRQAVQQMVRDIGLK